MYIKRWPSGDTPLATKRCVKVAGIGGNEDPFLFSFYNFDNAPNMIFGFRMLFRRFKPVNGTEISLVVVVFQFQALFAIDTSPVDGVNGGGGNWDSRDQEEKQKPGHLAKLRCAFAQRIPSNNSIVSWSRRS
jgi:hypothetical protein